jgi:hypothetical protein
MFIYYEHFINYLFEAYNVYIWLDEREEDEGVGEQENTMTK